MNEGYKKAVSDRMEAIRQWNGRVPRKDNGLALSNILPTSQWNSWYITVSPLDSGCLARIILTIHCYWTGSEFTEPINDNNANSLIESQCVTVLNKCRTIRLFLIPSANYFQSFIYSVLIRVKNPGNMDGSL